jgi:two-component system chemotaxis response regulator CheY
MRCLVVDDSRVIRKLASRMLADLEIATVEAENGLEAYDACVASMPDFILLDWNMPVQDGLTFLKRLRASNLTPQPKVVFCTTESDIDKITDGMAAGADEFMMKPFDAEILASKLRMVGLIQ